MCGFITGTFISSIGSSSCCHLDETQNILCLACKVFRMFSLEKKKKNGIRGIPSWFSASRARFSACFSEKKIKKFLEFGGIPGVVYAQCGQWGSACDVGGNWVFPKIRVALWKNAQAPCLAGGRACEFAESENCARTRLLLLLVECLCYYCNAATDRWFTPRLACGSRTKNARSSHN